MKKIVDYCVVWTEQAANVKLGQGFEPFGGVSICVAPNGKVSFAQAMVKYED